jgi:hypothetical protein
LPIHGTTTIKAEQKQKNEDFYSHELHERQSPFGIID